MSANQQGAGLESEENGQEADYTSRLLLAVGIVLLVLIMAVAAFAVGVYFAERGLPH